jgi:hypothetical protein
MTGLLLVAVIWWTLVVGLVFGWLLRGSANAAMSGETLDFTGSKPR